MTAPHEYDLHVVISNDLHQRAIMSIPFGVRSELYRRVLEMVVSSIEDGGPAALGAILTGAIKLALDEANETRRSKKGTRKHGS